MRQHSGKKRLGAVLLSLALCLSLLPMSALAADNVGYIYYEWNETTQTLSEPKSASADSATAVTASDTAWGASGETSWYVARGEVEIGSRVTVTGDVHLILADGAELTASKGIQVADDDNNPQTPSPNSLTIYGQAKGTGELIADVNIGHAGIGGNNNCDGGTVTIHGGNVTATGGTGGAGIGGGSLSDGGTVTIYGGTVTASSGTGGAGIGGGTQGDGGTVTATGGSHGAGIGGGHTGTAGTFSTGNNGHAVIFASSIADQSKRNDWNGVIFQGNEGQVYGTSITPAEDFSIPKDKKLTIETGKTLTIQEGVTLTNDGTITGQGSLKGDGTVINNGEMSVTNNDFMATVEVRVSPSPATYNSNVTLTATVKNGDSSVTDGSVTFYQGEVKDSNKLNSEPANVTSGTATASIQLTGNDWTPNETPYTITAVYTPAEGSKLLESSGTTTLTVNKATQTAPSAPTLSSRTSTSVVLNEITTPGQGAVQYGYTTRREPSMQENRWQTDTTFDDLTPGTTYTFYARYAGNEYYNPSPTSSGLAVTTERADSTLKVEPSSTTLTYGDTLTITVTPEQTADTNTRNTVKDAVELFIDGKLLNTDTGRGPSYTLTYDTKEQDLSIGDNTLTVGYSGSDSLNPSTAEVTVTLEKKNVTATLEGTTSKTYDGTTAAPAGLTIALTGVQEGDDVTASSSSITYDSADAGENKTITATGITLTGSDAAYYSLISEKAEVTTGIISKATPTLTLTADPAELSGGGDVTLTLSGLPSGGTATVTCDNSITVTANSDGTWTAGLPNQTADYTFTASYAGDNNHNSAKATCTVSVTQQVPPANPNYRVDLPTPENGTITADPAAAKQGTEVTLTVTPEEGYEVGEVTVTDRFGDTVEVTENADGTYTFTMPSGQVSVEVTFVEATPEPLPFTDVNEDDWFHDAVQYAYENGLMDGVGDGQFAPNATTNRAMVVTILYRLAGEPAVSGDVGFTDVEPGLWYSNAVSWAAEKGIVNGISETEFSPGGDLTREQLATILFRYAESAGYDVSASADLSGFPDAGDIQDYATEALSWAVAEGLLQGFEDDSLQPGGTATRAQIATILMRFCETVAE